jgi:chemotaxis protein methyltransferase CheR
MTGIDMELQSCRMSNEEYLLFNELIASELGITFPEHKREMLEARLRGRLRSLHLPRFLDYYLHLQSDANGERRRLAELVTNNETYFFREPQQLEALFSEIARAPGRPLRILSAGCSSGEEPYSLAMMARLNGLGLGPGGLQIDAFDVDASRIEMARAAEYGRSSLRAVTLEQLDQYFRPLRDDLWSLREPFREGVRFAWGNILDLSSFPSAGPYDVVFCRNVLIYFSEEALRSAVRCFARVLRPGGLLFLGVSESIIGLSEQLETVRLARAIAYRRVGP